MGLTLYAATIPSNLQILASDISLSARQKHFAPKTGAPLDLVQARLADDMLTFAHQVKSTAIHSLVAIEGVRNGIFSSDTTAPPDGFEGLFERVAETIAELEALDPAEVEADRTTQQCGENSILAFDQPARNVPLGMQNSPHVYVIASIKIEDQVRETGKLPAAQAGKAKIMGEAQ